MTTLSTDDLVALLYEQVGQMIVWERCFLFVPNAKPGTQQIALEEAIRQELINARRRVSQIATMIAEEEKRGQDEGDQGNS